MSHLWKPQVAHGGGPRWAIPTSERPSRASVRSKRLPGSANPALRRYANLGPLSRRTFGSLDLNGRSEGS